MKKIQYILLSVFSILFSTQAFSQDAVSFQASAPSTAVVGRQVVVSYSINKQPTAFRSPAFESSGFSLIMGPSTRYHNSMVVVGNNVQQSTSYIYDYTIQPTKDGTLTIPGAICTVDGKSYQANSVTIKVEAAPAQQSQPQYQYQQQAQTQQHQQSRPQAQQTQSSRFDEKSILIRAFASKNRALVGEQIIVTYKIYTEVPIPRFQISKTPSNKGFWAEELPSDVTRSSKVEYIDGRGYDVAEIRRIAVFPQEAGTLTIDPLSAEVLANIATQRQQVSTGDPFFDRFLNDPFFSGAMGQQVQTVKKDIKSNAVKITVDPLPQKPEGFSGGVGAFEITSSVDKESMKANEALTYKITLKGQGNLMLIDAPKISFPPDFEVYEPKVNSNIQRIESGISGSKTFEWILIPRNKGNYTIPAIDISYYDIRKQKYTTTQTTPYTIKVEKGDGSSALSTSASKEDIKLLNSDIDYINIHFTKLYEKNTAFFRSSAFWATLFSILGLTVIMIGFLFYKEKTGKDVIANRLRMATSIAKKRLHEAEKYLTQKNADAFYNEIYQALWGYIANKFNIEKANLSIENVEKILVDKNISPELIAQTIQVLQECDYARFAPGSGEDSMNHLYTASMQVITAIETFKNLPKQKQE